MVWSPYQYYSPSYCYWYDCCSLFIIYIIDHIFISYYVHSYSCYHSLLLHFIMVTVDDDITRATFGCCCASSASERRMSWWCNPELSWKIRGKPWEKHRKTRGKLKFTGKPWENGKRWEKHRKIWWVFHGFGMGIFPLVWINDSDPTTTEPW